MMPALNQALVPVPVQTPAQVQTPPAPVQTPAPAKVQRTRVQAPVQDEVPAPVVVNMPSVVNATLVAAVVNAPVVVQHVAVVGQDQVETPMEVEDEDALLQRLFFKKYGRALPETEKEKENDVDKINFVIDLTDETDEMEVATPVVVVKTEPIETVINVSNANVVDVAKLRQERRELVKGRKALIAFGKSLRKTDKIPEKETPEVVADSNVVTTVNPESITTDEAIEMAERAVAESEAAIAANQEFAAEFGDTPLDEFDDESEFRLFPDDTDVINDEDDAMIDDI